MDTVKNINIPDSLKNDISRAVTLLLAGGCSKVSLFGSTVEGTLTKNSDLDIAIRGCPQEKFFRVLGKLLLGLEHRVDLVTLDSNDAFSRYLLNEGTLVKVS